jgi:hypothetical protein
MEISPLRLEYKKSLSNENPVKSTFSINILEVHVS